MPAGRYALTSNSADSTVRTWVDIDGSIPFKLQPAPTAKSASATLTIAELQTLLITVSGTVAVALTLPTGALCDAGIPDLAINRAFEWSIVNTGTASAATTVVAGAGHTVVGGMIVAIGTSATFRTRKTAANTFVTYRID